MTRIILLETSTGRRVVDVPTTDSSWSSELNSAGSISCKIPLYDRRAKKIGFRLAATTLKTSLAIEENGLFMNGGPVWKHNYDEGKGTLGLDASGIKSYIDTRTVNSASAPSVGLLNSKGQPSTATTYTYNDISNSTIIKRIVNLIRGWQNSAFPIIFPDDELQSGNTITYYGADLKSAGEAIDDLIALSDGPDCMFDMEYVDADKNNVRWRQRSGTVAQRKLYSSQVVRWDASVVRRTIRNIQVVVDGTNLASVVWTTGGQSGNKALYDVQTNTKALIAGYPVAELVDGSHTDVTRQATLVKYGKESIRNSAMPTEYWTFEVRADRTPIIGTYKVGD